jgi:hypothetical protein
MPIDLTQPSEYSANNIPIPETKAVLPPQEIQEPDLWNGNVATPLHYDKQQHAKRTMGEQHWQQVTNQSDMSSQNEKTFQKQPHQSQILSGTHYPSPDSFFDLNHTISPPVAPGPGPVMEHESASLPDNAVGLLDIYFAYTDSWLPIVNKIAMYRTALSYSQGSKGVVPNQHNAASHATLWAALALASQEEGSQDPGNLI